MTPVAAKSRASSIGPVIAVALSSAWAFVSALAFAHANSFELLNVANWVPVVSFSIALALLAPTAWLIAELAGRGRPVVVAAILMAIGGLGQPVYDPKTGAPKTRHKVEKDNRGNIIREYEETIMDEDHPRIDAALKPLTGVARQIQTARRASNARWQKIGAFEQHIFG